MLVYSVFYCNSAISSANTLLYLLLTLLCIVFYYCSLFLLLMLCYNFYSHSLRPLRYLLYNSTVTWPYLLLLPRSLFLIPHLSQLSSIFPPQLVLLLFLAPLLSSLMADALFFHIFLRSPRSSSRLWSRNCRVTSSRRLFQSSSPSSINSGAASLNQDKLSHARLLRQAPPQTRDRGPGVHHNSTPGPRQRVLLSTSSEKP
jgi:hypothetical protein